MNDEKSSRDMLSILEPHILVPFLIDGDGEEVLDFAPTVHVPFSKRGAEDSRAAP